MSKSPSSKALLILALSGALGVGALAYYVKAEPGADKISAVLKTAPKSSISEKEISPSSHREASDSEDGDEVTKVNLPKIDGDSVKLDDESTPVPAGQNPMKFVVEKCLNESNVEGVTILDVDLERGIAILNFDDNIDSGMGGSQEGSFLKALQLSFGQFPKVKQIEIQKQNQPLSSLGNIEISGPLDVIRAGDPGESLPSKPTSP